jgi:hypothetical protein
VALAGCSSGSAGTANTINGTAGGAGTAGHATAGLALPATGATGTSGSTTGVAESRPLALSPTSLSGRDLVQTATVSVQVRDVAGATRKAEELVAKARGFVSDEQVHTDPAKPSEDNASMTVRVPDTAYDATIRALEGIGDRTFEQRSVQDVTDEIVDTSSRLATAKAGIQRVRTLLDSASSLGQVIQLESELTKREAELESMQRRLASLHRQVALSTITLSLSRSATAKPGAAKQHRSGFIGGITSGWHAFVSAVNGLLVAVGAVLPFALVLLAMVIGYVVIRRRPRPASTVGDDVTG